MRLLASAVVAGLLAAASPAAAAPWSHRLGSARVRALTAAQGAVVAATDRGLAVSTDGGRRFTVEGPKGIHSLATDLHGEALFAASGGRVFERVGGTLVRRARLPCRVALAAAGARVVYAGGTCGAFRSDDAGRTFRRLPAPARFRVRFVAAAPAVHDIVLLAGPDGIVVSRDGGRTFARRAAPPGRLQALGGDPLQAGRLLAVADGRGYVTSAAGWRRLRLPGRVTALAASPRVRGRRYAVAGGHLYVAGRRLASARFAAAAPILAGPVLVVAARAGGLQVHRPAG